MYIAPSAGQAQEIQTGTMTNYDVCLVLGIKRIEKYLIQNRILEILDTSHKTL